MDIRTSATYRVHAHLHGSYNTGTGVRFWERETGCSATAFPACIMRECLASVLCSHRERGQERNACVCVCV
jgi:hypothetical protein